MGVTIGGEFFPKFKERASKPPQGEKKKFLGRISRNIPSQ